MRKEFLLDAVARIEKIVGLEGEEILSDIDNLGGITNLVDVVSTHEQGKSPVVEFFASEELHSLITRYEARKI